MRTSQSFRVYFTIKQDKAKDGKAPLYASVTVNKEKSFIALKQKVSTAIWDFGNGAAKGNREESKLVAAYLGDVRQALGTPTRNCCSKGS